MQIKTTISDLLPAVKLTALVAGKKTTLPVTNHVLLKAEGAVLTVLGSNIQSFIRATCPCEVEKPGALCVPAEKLLAFLQNATAKDVSFELDGKKLKAVSGRSEVRFAFIPEGDFPAMPTHKSEWEVHLPEKGVVRGVDTVKSAMCDNFGRMALCGVNIELKENRCNFTATSGAHLIHVSTEHKGKGVATVSAEMVDFISRACGSESEEIVTLGFSENNLMVTGKSFVILGPIIALTFPNWRQSLQSESKLGFTFPRKQVIDSLKKIVPFTDERFNPIRLDFKDSLLTIRNTGGEHDAQDVVELDCLVPEFSVSVAPEKFNQILSVMKSEKVTMNTNDNLSPLVFEEQDFLALIMPCRLS